jgi:hypothetical protein
VNDSCNGRETLHLLLYKRTAQDRNKKTKNLKTLRGGEQGIISRELSTICGK